jgi:hypothetical protein
MSAFAEIHAALVDDDPLLAATLLSPEDVPSGGPTDGLQPDLDARLRIGVEAIREGHLLHWGEGRLVRTTDSDLALLAGDRLYALGLESVAGTGDRSAIVSLSRLIKASAVAMAASSEAGSESEWTATCERIGATEW